MTDPRLDRQEAPQVGGEAPRGDGGVSNISGACRPRTLRRSCEKVARPDLGATDSRLTRPDQSSLVDEARFKRGAFAHLRVVRCQMR